MSVFMSIISCARDKERGCHDAVRDTYLKTCDIDYRFVMGRDGRATYFDETVLGVDDSYGGVFQKYNAVCKMVYDAGYEYWFLCDVDTYVNIPRLIAAAWGEEYMGWRCDEGHAGGGHGIWFGRKVMKAICDHPAGGNHFDLHCGRVLADAGIKVYHNPEFSGSITNHLGRGTGNYDPQWMRDRYAMRGNT